MNDIRVLVSKCNFFIAAIFPSDHIPWSLSHWLLRTRSLASPVCVCALLRNGWSEAMWKQAQSIAWYSMTRYSYLVLWRHRLHGSSQRLTTNVTHQTIFDCFSLFFFTLSRFHFDCFVTKFSLFNILILLFVSLFNCRWMMMRSRVKYLMASIKWILYPNPKCYFYLYYYLFSCNKQPMKRSNKIIDFVLTTIIRYKWRILDGVRARAFLLYFHFV